MDDGVSGIGGIFFKARDKGRLLAWYRDHLGVDVQDWGGAIYAPPVTVHFAATRLTRS